MLNETKSVSGGKPKFFFRPRRTLRFYFRVILIPVLLSPFYFLLSPPLYAALACNSCHGTAAYPEGWPAYPSNYPIKGNSHLKHKDAGYSCPDCHIQVTTAAYTITFATNHVNNVYDVTPALGYDFATSSCATPGCHGKTYWGGPSLDCTSCHVSAVGHYQAGARRAIAGEFSLSWTHMRSSTPTPKVVKKQDCGICHMEGDPVTGGTTARHKDYVVFGGTIVGGVKYAGMIQLRDPDTNAQILFSTWHGRVAGIAGSTWTTGSYLNWSVDRTGYLYKVEAGSFSFVKFTRSVSTNVLEPWVTSVQNNLCLKCHDANKRAGDITPFFSSTGTAVDVSSHFAPTNASFHPVIGPQNNDFCDRDTMVAPWDVASGSNVPGLKTTGPLISCWDCHIATATAHGGPATLRAPYDYDTATDKATSLCIVCHKSTVYWNWTATAKPLGLTAFDGSNPNQGDACHPNEATTRHQAGDMAWPGCRGCHGTLAYSPTAEESRKLRAENAHGFNLLTTGGSAWGWGARPWAFIRNTTQYGNWHPYTATGYTFTSALAGTRGNCVGVGGTNNICGQAQTGHGGTATEGYAPGGRY